MTEERVVTVSGKETEGATRTWVVDTGGAAGLLSASSGADSQCSWFFVRRWMNFMITEAMQGKWKAEFSR